MTQQTLTVNQEQRRRTFSALFGKWWNAAAADHRKNDEQAEQRDQEKLNYKKRAA